MRRLPIAASVLLPLLASGGEPAAVPAPAASPATPLPAASPVAARTGAILSDVLAFGGLGSEAVTPVLRGVTSQVAGCAPALGASDRVRLEAELWVLPDGKVREVSLTTSGAADGGLVPCASKHLEGMRFGASSGETAVQAAWTLSVSLAPGVLVLAGDPELRSGLDRRQVDEVVRAAGPAFSACVAGSDGNLRLKTTLSPDGAVSRVEVHGSTLSVEIGDCFAKVMQGLRFPAVVGGASFTYPLVIGR